MKKLLLIVTALLLVFILTCCKKKTVDDLSDLDPLFTVGDTVLMDVKYFRQLRTEMNVSNDILGTSKLKDTELFIQEAEKLFISHIAEEYKINADRAEIGEEYDDHIEEIKDSSVYPNQLLYYTTLRDALGFSPAQIKEFVVNENYKDKNVSNVLDDIAASYSFVTDKDILIEYFQINLLEMLETSDVTLSFPDVSIYKLNFMDILEDY